MLMQLPCVNSDYFFTGLKLIYKKIKYIEITQTIETNLELYFPLL